jgi:hypothetical protein
MVDIGFFESGLSHSKCPDVVELDTLGKHTGLNLVVGKNGI